MLNKYNQRLHDLANGSMLTRIGVSLYICDENLIVCMRSAGASGIMSRLIIGSDMKKSLDQSFVEQLLVSHRVSSELLFIHDTMVDALFIPDELDGIRYFIVLCEPDRLPSDGELTLSAENIGLELIGNCIAVEVKRLLEKKCENLAKLTESLKALISGRRMIGMFSGDQARLRCEFGTARVSIYRVASTIKDELSKQLSKHSLEIVYHGLEAYCDNASFKSITSFIGTVVFNLFALSSDKSVKLEIDAPRDCRVKVHFSTSVSKRVLAGFTPTRSAENDAVALIERYSPFAFELAICKEFAAKRGWEIELMIEDGRMEIAVVFSIHKVKYIPYVRGNNHIYLMKFVSYYSSRLDSFEQSADADVGCEDESAQVD